VLRLPTGHCEHSLSAIAAAAIGRER